MDEAAVRRAVGGLMDAGGRPLLQPDEVGQVAVEGEWAAVVLAREGASRDLLRRVYYGLAEAFPGAAFDVRSENRVYRGGPGFGE